MKRQLSSDTEEDDDVDPRRLSATQAKRRLTTAVTADGAAAAAAAASSGSSVWAPRKREREESGGESASEDEAESEGEDAAGGVDAESAELAEKLGRYQIGGPIHVAAGAQAPTNPWLAIRRSDALSWPRNCVEYPASTKGLWFRDADPHAVIVSVPDATHIYDPVAVLGQDRLLVMRRDRTVYESSWNPRLLLIDRGTGRTVFDGFETTEKACHLVPPKLGGVVSAPCCVAYATCEKDPTDPPKVQRPRSKAGRHAGSTPPPLVVNIIALSSETARPRRVTLVGSAYDCPVGVRLAIEATNVLCFTNCRTYSDVRWSVDLEDWRDHLSATRASLYRVPIFGPYTESALPIAQYELPEPCFSISALCFVDTAVLLQVVVADHDAREVPLAKPVDILHCIATPDGRYKRMPPLSLAALPVQDQLSTLFVAGSPFQPTFRLNYRAFGARLCICEQAGRVWYQRIDELAERGEAAEIEMPLASDPSCTRCHLSSDGRALLVKKSAIGNTQYIYYDVSGDAPRLVGQVTLPATQVVFMYWDVVF